MAATPMPQRRRLFGLPRRESAPAQARVHGWRYAEVGKRDLRIDLLRGFAVFAMVVDHIGGSSWLYSLSGGNRFFVSAAEAFVFLSGLTVGIVYGGIAVTQGLRPGIHKLLARAWVLYSLSVWLTIGFALTATILDDPIGQPFAAAPARFIFEVITLQRTFYLADVLLVYLFAMLAATGALALLKRGWWWAVAALSLGLWGALQAWPDRVQLPWPIADNPVFLLAAWQLPFFVAMIIGYHRHWLGEHILARFPASPLRDGYVLPLGAAVGFLAYLSATNAAIFAPYVPGGNTAALLDAWFLKSQLPLPRLLAAIIVFAFAWTLVTRFWVPLKRLAGPFLLVLGQGALYAYAAHLFLAALVQAGALTLVGPSLSGGLPSLPPALSATIQIGALAVLWALTRVRFLQGVVAPLGGAPFIRRGPGARLPLRPSEPLLAILLVALVTMAYTLPAPTMARAAAQPTPTPQSTITAPRQIAGAAVGSSAKLPAASTVTAPRQIGMGSAAVVPASTITAPRSVAGTAISSSGLSTVATSSTNAPETSISIAPTPAPASPAHATTTPQVSGGYLRDGSFYSDALGRTMPYGIYFPPGYDEGTRRYPVLYMLHGSGGHYSEWVSYGFAETAERLIQSGRIAPLIIVFVQGDQSYFVNHATDGERWGDYITQDLIGHVDTTYRTVAIREGRAIGGLSMGGFGALSLAFSHPDLYVAVGAHSPALRTQIEASDFLGDPEQYALVDPMVLAQTLDPTMAPKVWIDVGVIDTWASRTTALKDILRARGILPEYSENAGGHDAQYWEQNSARYLRFYASSFSLIAPHLPTGAP